MKKNDDKNDDINFIPKKQTALLTAVQWSLIICTGGIFGLILLWSKQARSWFRVDCIESEATHFMVESNGEFEEEVSVQIEKGIPFFEFEALRYIFDNETSKFKPPEAGYSKWKHKDLCTMKGLKTEDLLPAFTVRHGRNLIDVPMTPLWQDIGDMFLSPVNFYQYACVLLWCFHDYVGYAMVLLAFIFISGAYDIFTERSNRLKIKTMSAYIVLVRVFRDGAWSDIYSDALYPGDYIKIPANFKAPCDIALSTGGVVVDEASLTGETTPIAKFPPLESPDSPYNADKDKKCTIYGGTIVVNSFSSIQKRKKKQKSEEDTAAESKGENVATGIVVRTGFFAAKGQLIRKILFLRPIEHSYQNEAKIFLGILCVISLGLFFASFYMWGGFSAEYDPENIIYAFEVITTMVPSQLPTIFLGALLFSAKTLETYQVFVTNTSRIPLAGRISVQCFDKTGTLTKNDLDMLGVVPAYLKNTSEHTSDDKDKASKKPSAKKPRNMVRQVFDIKETENDLLLWALSTCHTLSETYSEEDENPGDNSENVDTEVEMKEKNIPKYSGPMVDMKIFGSTGMVYSNASEESPANVSDGNVKLDILKRFDFDHVLQCMSSVVNNTSTKDLYIFTKGSFESISKLCKASTVPSNASALAKSYSKNGCYVLAIAYRHCADMTMNDIPTLQRKNVEQDLTFLGLILLRNELKDDTAENIRALHRGHIRTLIVTGDNIFTGSYVAVKSGVISPEKELFIGDVEDVSDSTGGADAKKKVVFRHIHDPWYIIDPNTLRLTKDSQLERDDDESEDGDAEKDSEETEKLHLNSKHLIKPTVSGGQLSIDRYHAEFGVTAAAFEILKKNNLDFLRHDVCLFARMKPLQKEEVVNFIKETGAIVGMCGDGANDCAALAAAHCGVALSLEETSAVSPFSGASLSINAVVELVRVGRACLINSFVAFKYIIIYGVIETAQSMTAYYFNSDMANWQYVVIDYLFFFPAAFFTVKSNARSSLKHFSPTDKVFGITTLTSIIGQCIIGVLVVSIPFTIFPKIYTDYVPSNGNDLYDYSVIPETTMVWFIGSALYPAIGFTLTYGTKWRKPFYHNVGVMVSGGITYLVLIIFLFYPDSWDNVVNVHEFMEFSNITWPMRIIVLISGAIGVALILIYEYATINLIQLCKVKWWHK